MEFSQEYRSRLKRQQDDTEKVNVRLGQEETNSVAVEKQCAKDFVYSIHSTEWLVHEVLGDIILLFTLLCCVVELRFQVLIIIRSLDSEY